MNLSTANGEDSVKVLKLWHLFVFFISFLLTPAAYAQPKVSLTLTYAAGRPLAAAPRIGALRLSTSGWSSRSIPDQL